MESNFTLAKKKKFVTTLMQDIVRDNIEVKKALEERDILLFRSFRLHHAEFFEHENTDEPICIQSLKEAFKLYLLNLSRMGFLTYYLDGEE